MSNKAGGKRPAITNSDVSKHNMVSEVPPERPSVRVSLAPKARCQAGVLGNIRARPAVSTGFPRAGEVMREEWRVGREEGSYQHLAEDPSLDRGLSTLAPSAFGAKEFSVVWDCPLNCRMSSSILGPGPSDASSTQPMTTSVSRHCSVSPVRQNHPLPCPWRTADGGGQQKRNNS